LQGRIPGHDLLAAFLGSLVGVGFPAFVFAVLGVNAAQTVPSNSAWPYKLLAGIALPTWVIIIGVVAVTCDFSPGTFLVLFVSVFLAILCLCGCLCGFFSIYVFRKGSAAWARNQMDYPPGYQDHFAPNSKQADEETSPHVQAPLHEFRETLSPEEKTERDAT